METTIYVSKDHRHLGLGRFLYDALETALKAQGILKRHACIGYPETEDEYLTKNSARFMNILAITWLACSTTAATSLAAGIL